MSLTSDTARPAAAWPRRMIIADLRTSQTRLLLESITIKPPRVIASFSWASDNFSRSSYRRELRANVWNLSIFSRVFRNSNHHSSRLAFRPADRFLHHTRRAQAKLGTLANFR